MVKASVMQKHTSTFKIIRFFFSPYKKYFLFLMALSLILGFLETINIAAVFPILSSAFETGFSQDNAILGVLGKFASLLPVSSAFIAYCIIFIGAAILTFIVKYISVIVRVRFSARLIGDSQIQVFSRFVKADYQYFIDHKQGELMYNVSTAPQRLSGLAMSVTELVSQIILTISVFVLIFSLSWLGALLVIFVGVAYQFFTRSLGEKITYHAAKGEMESLQENTVIVNETISGIKQVKVFVSAEDWIKRFNSTLQKRWYHYIRRNIWQQIPNPALILVLYLAVGIIAIIIKMVAAASFISLIPIFGTFIFAIFRMVPMMGNIGDITMSVLGSMPDCETVFSILNEKIKTILDGDKELTSLPSKIQFKNVTFNYRGRKSILENISITFEKGKTTAIVGSSGSGKTTVLNLLLRLFEPDKGTIEIDGVNLREYKLDSWLNKVGYVSQDTFIFNDSIKNNITFHSNKYSDEDVIEAAKYAQAHGFINELPHKYETIVGDRGVKLSGGQGQRVAVARAMIRKPEIFVFDEATNALDNISEAAVQKAIDEISKDHTVIIVAHRLSTISNASKIIVLGQGRILEEGTHKELLEKKGAYWELYRSQPQI